MALPITLGSPGVAKLLRMFRRAEVSFSGRALLFAGFLYLGTMALADGHGAQGGNPQAVSPPNGEDRPVVVELFTSEGCSSCPPADTFLQKLDAYQPIEHAQLIVLSEHVTYWDHEGWKDPNSSAELTDRQSAYEHALGVKEPYTPQFIVDGALEANMRDLQKFQETLNKAAAEPKIPIRVSDIAVSGDLLRAHIETDPNSDKHSTDVFVAVALDHVESEVLHGENGGKHLVNIAVVQQLTKVGKLAKEKMFAQDVQLKLKPGADPKNLRLIVFVQQSSFGKILGAFQRKPLS